MYTAEQARSILVDRLKRGLDNGAALDHDIDRQRLLVDALVGLATEVTELGKKVRALEAEIASLRGAAR